MRPKTLLLRNYLRAAVGGDKPLRCILTIKSKILNLKDGKYWQNNAGNRSGGRCGF